MEEVKYYISDIESGELIEVTKEEKERYLQLWSWAKQLVSREKRYGKIIVFGTGGNIEHDKIKEFKELWNLAEMEFIFGEKETKLWKK